MNERNRLEADRLKAGKAPRDRGSVEEINGNYRAHFFWKDSDSQRNAYGPRRAEKRRAEDDLEALREASVGQADLAARSFALAAQSHRLQEQAGAERRVELLAHRRSAQQQSAQLQPPQPLAHQACEELNGSEDDWEVEEM